MTHRIHPVAQIAFAATEAVYADGVGRASNSKGLDTYHYVLFGRTRNAAPPAAHHGHYFEFDAPNHWSTDTVRRVVVSERLVEFDLPGRQIIIFRDAMTVAAWDQFLLGIVEVFGMAKVVLDD